MKTVYLAGKITGDPDYRGKFMAAAQLLELNRFVVVNPATLPLPSSGLTYEAYMRISSVMLDECEAACFLGDWENSEGAKIEYLQAQDSGKEIFFFEERHQKLRDASEAGGGAAV